jgi:hypothetical protein
VSIHRVPSGHPGRASAVGCHALGLSRDHVLQTERGVLPFLEAIDGGMVIRDRPSVDPPSADQRGSAYGRWRKRQKVKLVQRRPKAYHLEPSPSESSLSLRVRLSYRVDQTGSHHRWYAVMFSLRLRLLGVGCLVSAVFG